MNCTRLKFLIGLSLAATACVVSAGGEQPRTIAEQCPAAAAWKNAHPDPANTFIAAKPSDPVLRAQLLSMMKADQDARDALIDASGEAEQSAKGRQMIKVDATNLKQLKPIIVAHGFPTPAMVGVDGVNAAFILVQHADREPAFQAQVLPQLARLQKQGKVSTEKFALLTDRVLRAQGKPQRYGTQFSPDKARGGVIAPEPMLDPANVEARRARIGLLPLKDYACVLAASYKTKVSVQPMHAINENAQK